MSNEHFNTSRINVTKGPTDDILIGSNERFKNISGIQIHDGDNNHQSGTIWATVMIIGIALFVVSGLIVSLIWKRRKEAIPEAKMNSKAEQNNITPKIRRLEQTELLKIKRNDIRSVSMGNIYSFTPRPKAADDLLNENRASYRHSII